MTTQEYVFKLTAKIDDFTKNMDAAAKKMNFTEQQGKTFARNLSRAMSSTSPEVQKLGRDMSSLASQYNSQIQQFKKYTDEISKAGQKIAELSEQHARQSEQVAETEAKVAELARVYEEAAQKQNAMKEAMEAGQRVKVDVWARVTSEAETAKQALDEMNAKLEEQRGELGQTEGAMNSWSNVAQISAQNAGNMSQEVEATKNEMLGMSKHVSKLTGISTVLKGMGASFKSAAVNAGKLGTTLAGLVKSGFGKLTSKTKDLYKHFRETATQSHSLDKAVKKLTSSFGSFGNLLIRRFKRQIISEIFNGLKTGINNVAKESDSFNAALSQMGGALQTFANALGSAFAPILEAAAPIITQFVNFLTDAVSQVGQLTSALTGKDTFMKAIPVTYDYAKSLDSTAKSADKATKSTEKQNKATQDLKKTILSFDQLHTLNGDDDGTDSTASATEKAFETQKIASNISNYADKLVKALKSGDWTKLGSLMAEGVNKAFSWVDNLVKWENCGEKITKIITAITETFNSFVKNLDWKLIGQTVGDGINTLVNSLLLLQEKIDWKALGGGFGNLVASLFETVDWENVGAVIIGHIQSILYMIQGFVSTPELFENIGNALHDLIAGAIDKLDPEAFGDTLGKVVNGLATILVNGFSDIEKFTELGSKLASNVNTALDTLDPELMATGLSNFVLSIFNTIISFVEETDWEELGKKVQEFVSNINWSDVSDALFEAIGAAFGGILEFFKGLFEQPWNDFIEWFKGLAGDDGELTIGEFLDGIANALLDIAGWIEEHIAKPFLDGLAKAFGFGDFSEMAEDGRKVIKDLFAGIEAALTGVVEWVREHITGPIVDAIETCFGFVGDVATGLKGIGEGIVSGITDGLSGITTAITDALSGVESVLKAPFDAAWTVISPIIDAIKNFQLPDWVTDNFITQGAAAIGNTVGGWASSVIDLIPHHASGGFPEDGLFFANHGEMVGSFANGKTAVANNDQITGGISIAVADAVVPVLLDILGAVKANKSAGESTIEIDGERLARIVTRNQRTIALRESAF